ncbi:MAG: hypothetical protein BGO36_04630 [Burkholderiales bacterium 68-10]|uniref:hypothetical protein n=1 Tax=Acidovorax sp. SDU_ACID1 TaxID=3136632 RepID=UPI0009687989|nr:hypothetical protein [Comamonadaceae bacterium]OJV54000.1 MAG: hypothetical protein BGO36_04630 [Burkholderiales bacterium 68-10]
MTQTLCPYALTPLTAGESNDEHILPVALGAPDNFTVRALVAENSRMNDLIDEPTIIDPLVRFMAMSQGVTSRSGSVRATVDGAVRGSGESVKATFSQNGVDLKFHPPVDTDSQGRVIGVRGFGEDARKMAEQIAANYAKKGIAVELGPETSQGRPQLDLGLGGDMLMIQRQLFKIAYLMTVRIFGDEAITGSSGQQLRAAMMAETDEALAAIGITGGVDLPPGLARSAGHSEHAITCAVFSAGLVTSVELFGCFRLFVVTPLDGISTDEGTGEVITINASSSTLTSRPYLEALPDLMAVAFKAKSAKTAA